AIVVGDGADLRVLQALAILIGLGWGALALTVNSNFGRGFFLVTSALGLAAALADILRGPRCRCLLKTAVSLESLPSVSRRSIASRFSSAIAQAVQATQSDLPPVAPAVVSVAPVAEPTAPAPPIEAGPAHRSYVAECLFVLLIIDA